MYTGAQSARFAFSRRFRVLSACQNVAGPALRPARRVTRGERVKSYCFFDTEMWVMSMMPISKSSAVSVTPCTYGFKRYFVAEK